MSGELGSDENRDMNTVTVVWRTCRGGGFSRQPSHAGRGRTAEMSICRRRGKKNENVMQNDAL